MLVATRGHSADSRMCLATGGNSAVVWHSACGPRRRRDAKLSRDKSNLAGSDLKWCSTAGMPMRRALIIPVFFFLAPHYGGLCSDMTAGAGAGAGDCCVLLRDNPARRCFWTHIVSLGAPTVEVAGVKKFMGYMGWSCSIGPGH